MIFAICNFEYTSVSGGSNDGLIKDETCYNELSRICDCLKQQKVILHVVHINYLNDEEKIKLSSLALKTGGRCVTHKADHKSRHIAKVSINLYFVKQKDLLSSFVLSFSSFGHVSFAN